MHILKNGLKTGTNGLVFLPLGYIIFVFLLFLLEKNDPGANITSIQDALWYSIVTLTTVGYGDFYPVTSLGKIIGLLFVFSSLGLVGYIFGKLTERFIEYRERGKMGLNGTDFTNHIIIIGWNSYASSITKQLVNAENKVAIITDDKSNIDLIYQEYDQDNVFVVFSDLKNTSALQKVNASKAFLTVVNLNDDTENLILILNIKQDFPNMEFLVTIENSELKETFKSAGVTYALSRNEISSKLIASYIFEPDVADFTSDLLTSAKESDQYDIQQFKVIEENPYLGKTYGETFDDLKATFNVLLIGIAKNTNGKHQLYKLPSEEITIAENDYLILIVNGKTETSISELFQVKEGVTR